MIVSRCLWSESQGSLAPWRSTIESEIDEALTAISHFGFAAEIDILIQRVPDAAIPEIGMAAHVYRRGLLGLTLDPDNATFSNALMDGNLRRLVVHEVHHCLRMAGPGYGTTLGEALVSEGLAGQFASHVFGSPPEPWECAFDKDYVFQKLPRRAELSMNSYDHSGWFYGAGDKRPQWFGYTLGYMIVGRWLESTLDIEGATWINVPAALVLESIDFPH